MLYQKTTAPYTIETGEAAIPPCGKGQVLVKMKQVGVCGSDLQIYHGQHPYVNLPLVQGHEGWGIVEAVGEDVLTVSVGDLVAIFPLQYCGNCHACRQGRHNICTSLRFIGVHADGLFAEYVCVNAENVVRVPKDMDQSLLAFIEPAAVGVAAAIRAGAQPGKTIAVIGGGPIGNLTAQACRAMGAEVLLTDLADSKLELAHQKGIPHVQNTLSTTLGQAIQNSFTNGYADAIIDCVGMPATLQNSIDASANGTTILVVGNFKQPVLLELPVLQRREVNLIGLYLYTLPTFEKAIDFLYDKHIDISGMVSGHFPLKDLPLAFSTIDQHPGEVIKVIIDIS